MEYEEALKIAELWHRGQVRKFSGIPAITHPIEVARAFDDNDMKVISVFHDVIEDTEMTLDDLMCLGAPKNLVEVIEILSKPDDEDYLPYLLRCRDHSVARLIKIADVRHNLIDAHKDRNMKTKLDMALYILTHELMPEV